MELLKENDLRLLEMSEPWDFEVDGDPTEFVTEMAKHMALNGGIGLAAPQLGVMKSIFIMGNSQKLIACINPKIISLSQTRSLELEGCLSFPDLYFKVKRPDSCVIQYQNTKGESIERELSGMEARVFLHEFDHLIGVTFDQRVSKLVYDLAEEKRKKIVKRKLRVNV